MEQKMSVRNTKTSMMEEFSSLSEVLRYGIVQRIMQACPASYVGEFCRDHSGRIYDQAGWLDDVLHDVCYEFYLEDNIRTSNIERENLEGLSDRMDNG